MIVGLSRGFGVGKFSLKHIVLLIAEKSLTLKERTKCKEPRKAALGRLLTLVFIVYRSQLIIFEHFKSSIGFIGSVNR